MKRAGSPVRDPSRILTRVVERLSMASSLVAVTETVAEAARAISGADGATFVLRDGDRCYYADENAVAPLWKGRRFPAESCISGWSMIHRQVVVIRDIYVDPRIPHDAYRPTFVRSLCMVPIRVQDPIGAIGNYWATEYVPTDEEIKLLQVLANSSAIALENLELKDAIRRRSETREGVEDRNREIDAVIHSLAHDLRSPIATMMGFAELVRLRKAAGTEESAAEYLHAIIETGSQACQQIERMLALYRTANHALEPRVVDLTAIAGEIVENLRTREPGCRAEVRIDSDLVALADPWLIRRALENLLSNAFKYSSHKPDALVQMGRAAQGEHEATFFVRDNGAGFDAAQADRLFQPLVRLHSDTEFTGTGLGLASVARIVELHGGRVRAEGRISEGATFYFSLPTHAPSSGAAEPVPTTNQDSSSGLPCELRVAIQEAARVADYEHLEALIASLLPEHGDSAQELRRLLDMYAYDEIARRVEPRS